MALIVILALLCIGLLVSIGALSIAGNKDCGNAPVNGSQEEQDRYEKCVNNKNRMLKIRDSLGYVVTALLTFPVGLGIVALMFNHS